METYAIILIVMFATLILVPLLTYIIWAILHPKKHETVPGYHPEITVKHNKNPPTTHKLELYYQMFSSNSTKVRCALGEAGLVEGVDFIGHSINMHDPAEAKGWTFLKINPAGTVPCLVHNGHPIYHSHEQIRYILKTFCKPGLLDVEDRFKKECEESIETTSMMKEEIDVDPIKAMEKRAGNCLFPMTIPMFVGNMVYGGSKANSLHMGLTDCMKQLLWIPIAKDNMKVVGMFMASKKYGKDTVEKVAPIKNFVDGVKSAIEIHMKNLNVQVCKYEGKYLFGDELSMADLGWIPILDRMKKVGWLDLFDKSSYAGVWKYWNALEKTSFYAEKERNECHKMTPMMEALETFKKESGVFEGLKYV